MRVYLQLSASLCLMICFCMNMAFAQQQSKLDVALQHIESNVPNWQLTPQDISDIVVSDNYYSKLSKVQRIIFQQRHAGIKIFQAVVNVGISENGNAYSIGHSFTPEAATKVNATSPIISAEAALLAGLDYLEIVHNNEIKLKERISDQAFIFEQTSFTNGDIKVELTYQPLKDKSELRLAWDMTIEQKGADYWGLRIDALDGSFVHKTALTIHCQFHDNAYHRHDASCQQPKRTVEKKTAAPQQTTVTGAEYNVFAFPVESPVHGERSLVTDPANLAASPFGWHDTNGADGAEYTTTRGNNVHAYIDAAAADEPNEADPEPDGGSDLHFDAPYIEDTEPGAYQDAATINLFYAGNMMHDICYAHGFDEAAGNFQANNYGNGGIGGDYMRMEAQDGLGTNNANYSGSSDGNLGRVQMFVWDRNAGGQRYIQVAQPSNIAGNYPAIIADYGPSSIPSPINADVVEVNDGIYDPYVSDGCESGFLNGNELNGKIALVDRGGCYFVEKTLNAQAFGAVALIVCNYEDDAMNMVAADGFDTPSIPTISVGRIDCSTIREYIGNGLQLTLGPPPTEGPNFLDGDFDNGIICHEYAHGVSNRCVGGPSMVCLTYFDEERNQEQMGEGWSDFFSIVNTVQPGDGPEIWRGVGTYVYRQPTTGKGIRSYPYSPDMEVNPLTYGDIGTQSVPHGVGTVWCTMLWDLYWEMVAEYGWSEDLYNGDAGNNMTIRLVIEGMKNLACDPGFVDARDGIMQADMDLYGGANQCLISKVFARRGLGIHAEQGSPDSAADGTENFDPIPTCIPELKITKTATPLISPGGEITYTIKVINHRPMTLTNVVVTDETPSGLTYVNNSASIAPAEVAADMITFDLGDMAYEEEVTITYRVVSNPSNKSTRLVYEDLEDGSDDNWFIENITGFNVWDIDEDDAYSGTYSWNIPNVDVENDQLLFYDPTFTVNADNPVLRFYHRFDTEAGADGGIIEISNDGGIFWSSVPDYMIRNGYTGLIQYTTFVVPNLQTFWGNSDGWMDTYVDLSAYAGQEISIRFRFASDDNTAPANGGWFVDDIEYMDMFSYQGEACVTSEEGDEVCAAAADVGTIVNPVPIDVSIEEIPSVAHVNIFPNPANDLLNINLTSKQYADLAVSVLSTDGREIIQRTVGTHKGNQTISLDVSALSAGFYFVRLTSEEGNIVRKIVIE